jgi:hypothetical protein
MTRAKSKPSMPKASKPKASEPVAIKPSKLEARKPALKVSKVAEPKPIAAKPSVPKPALTKRSQVKASTPELPTLTSKPEPAKAERANGKTSKQDLALGASKPKLGKAEVSRAKASKVAAPPPNKRVDTKAMLRPIEQAVGVSSDAVARRTGKSWAEWFALLDAAGAAELDHKGIVAVLAQRHGVGPWWQQMVTVAYEKARGMREHQESDEGFKAGVIKTLELPLAKLYRFWAEPSERNKWLADDRFSIHKATASKSIRARWGRGVSRIDVDFCEKGPSKSQVTVQHNRIETSDAAEQMKAYWAKKISALEALLTRA